MKMEAMDEVAGLHKILYQMADQLGEMRGDLKGIREDLRKIESHDQRIVDLEKGRAFHAGGMSVIGLVSGAVGAILAHLMGKQ